MSVQTDSDDDSIERFEVTDQRTGDTFAILTYHDERDPSTRFGTWVVDFPNGDRLTGDGANEVARLLMNETGGLDGAEDVAFPAFEGQADSILESLTYDDDSGQYRITVRGVRVWFAVCTDVGDDVVLYQTRDAVERAGVIEDAPFDSEDLEDEMGIVRRHGGRF